MYHAHKQFTALANPLTLANHRATNVALFEDAVKDRVCNAAALNDAEREHVSVTFKYDNSIPIPMLMRIEQRDLSGESLERFNATLRMFEPVHPKAQVTRLDCSSHVELTSRTVKGLATSVNLLEPTCPPIDATALQESLPRPKAFGRE